MPTNTAVNLGRVYVKDADLPTRRESALRAIHQLLQLADVSTAHQKELLSIGIWKWTEAEGVAPHAKYHLRFRSRGALELGRPAKVNHEHVWPRRWIIEQLLATPERSLVDLRAFLERYAVACTVTVEEHARLGAVNATGWDRYARAGVQVWDMLEDRPFVLPAAEREVVTAPLPEQETAPFEVDDIPESLDRVTIEEAIAQRSPRNGELLTALVQRLDGEDVVLAVGMTRKGEIGDYLRVHDNAMGEPSSAVAYLHWSGKVSLRLQPGEVPEYLAQAVREADHAYFAVTMSLHEGKDVDIAEALIELALEKTRQL